VPFSARHGAFAVPETRQGGDSQRRPRGRLDDHGEAAIL